MTFSAKRPLCRKLYISDSRHYRILWAVVSEATDKSPPSCYPTPGCLFHRRPYQCRRAISPLFFEIPVSCIVSDRLGLPHHSRTPNSHTESTNLSVPHPTHELQTKNQTSGRQQNS